MSFPTPNATESQNIVALGKFLNEQIYGHLFGITILIVLFIIMFITLKEHGTEEALATSSFVTAVLSYLLMVMDWVSPDVTVILTLITAVSIIFVWRGR